MAFDLGDGKAVAKLPADAVVRYPHGKLRCKDKHWCVRNLDADPPNEPAPAPPAHNTEAKSNLKVQNETLKKDIKNQRCLRLFLRLKLHLLGV